MIAEGTLDLIRLAINNGAREIHAEMVRMGWYKDPQTRRSIQRNKMEMLMLIVTEVAEAAEGLRKNLPDDKLPHRPMVEVELADTIIRILDLAAYMDLDVGGALVEKCRYNATREDHKLSNRALPGGKSC